MSRKSDNEKAEEFLNRIFDFFADPPKNLNIVTEVLESEGINVEAFWDRTEKLIKKLRGEKL